MLNKFHAHGVLKLILNTFEATIHLLWKVMQTPILMEINNVNNDENDNIYVFGTLVTYAGMMDHLSAPSCIMGSSSSHFIVQPISNATISLPNGLEKFSKLLQPQFLKVV